MSTYKKKFNLFETEEGVEIKEALQKMVADASYNTRPSYSANVAIYPDRLMPFVNKHMDYLRNHPATDPWHYVSNLRLITRLK